LDSIEVIVVVEEDAVVLQGELGDEAIRRAADCDPFSPAVVIDPCGVSVRRNRVDREQQILGSQILCHETPLPLVLDPLQDLLKAYDWHREEDSLPFEILQTIGCWRVDALQQIDQD